MKLHVKTKWLGRAFTCASIGSGFGYSIMTNESSEIGTAVAVGVLTGAGCEAGKIITGIVCVGMEYAHHARGYLNKNSLSASLSKAFDRVMYTEMSDRAYILTQGLSMAGAGIGAYHTCQYAARLLQ